MTEPQSLSTPASRAPAMLAGLTLALAAAISWMLIGPDIARLGEPADGYDLDRLVLLYSSLPRILTAIVAGAALALSGSLLQQVLRNPLASPTTLGFSAGANLALAATMVMIPSLIGIGRDLVALAGSGVSAAIVFGTVARRDFSPVALVLAGLIVSLYCGALSAVLILLNDRYLMSLFIWGNGSLAQQSWAVPLGLLARIGILFALSIFLLRPLTLMALDEANARSLGINVRLVRIAAVALALALAAFVTSAVGVIGFIGLVAPAAARLAGARRFREQIVWAPALGAGLLWLTDGVVQLAAGPMAAFLPTGAVTALFGTPLLLFLLPRLRAIESVRSATLKLAGGAATRRPVLAGLAVAAGLALLLAFVLGRSPAGSWTMIGPAEWEALLPWRMPRVMAAAAAGAMLAVAGTILQRLTANPMASPEVLGISAGSTIGVALALFLLGAPTYGSQATFAALGALAVLAVILAVSRNSGFQPERVLLAGIALNALMDAVIGVLAASGDPRALQLLQWMGGSTHGIESSRALLTLAAALVLVPVALLARRWLDLMVLGPVTASALGLRLRLVRMLMIGLAAVATAIGTMIAGPLSFVGLMAPHIARELGLRHAASQLAGAALAGGILLVSADFLGRTIAHPYEIPAGLVSALIGTPFLMLLINRRQG